MSYESLEKMLAKPVKPKSTVPYKPSKKVGKYIDHFNSNSEKDDYLCNACEFFEKHNGQL